MKLCLSDSFSYQTFALCHNKCFKECPKLLKFHHMNCLAHTSLELPYVDFQTF